MVLVKIILSKENKALTVTHNVSLLKGVNVNVACP